LNTTSLSLLARLQTDDSPAWDRFVTLYTPLLFYWTKRVGLPPTEADDYVQEVLVLLLDKLKQFEHRGHGSFRGWLRTVAINKCRERFRRRQPSLLEGSAADFDLMAQLDASSAFWEQEYREHLMARALEIMQAEFEPKTWQACWQRIVEDLPAKEVARNLDLTEGSVYVYAGRVLRRLREDLSDLLD
jgi:RNA polymerase sigma-70 factor (ECF subfamily)